MRSIRNIGRKQIGIILFFALVLAVSIYMTVRPIQAKTAYDTIETTILKIGKADAIVVEAPYQTMVIDCGEEEDGLEVLQFLQNRGIDHVDVLVVTHYDKDHVGGADTLIEGIRVDRVLVPDYDGTSTEYVDFVAAMDAAGIVPERLTESVSFTIGDANVLVEPPLSYDLIGIASHDPTLEVDNDLSLITTIVHGELRMVFTGDAEKLRLREWLATASAVPCNFLKIPHHGVYNTEMDQLALQLAPEYTAICSSAKNPADVRTIEVFKAAGAGVMETKDGDIVIVSNGEQLDISQY